MKLNNDSLSAALDRLDAAETERLLAQIESVPLSKTALRRIRKRGGARAGIGRPRAAMPRALRILAPVAAVLCVTAILFSIPAVSKAVSDWFVETFRLEQYMSVPAEARTPDPDIEQAISTPDTRSQQSAVRYLDELPWYENVENYRLENGFAAFDRADYAWAANLKPELREVFYDGHSLMFTTWFNASPVRFAGVYGVEGCERFDITMDDVRLFDASGQELPIFMSSTGTQIGAMYYDAEKQAYDLDAIRAADGTYLLSTVDPGGETRLPDGVVTVQITYGLYDGTIDDMATVGLIAEISHRFTFDASAANAAVAEVALAPVTFSGTHLVSTGRSGNGADGTYFYENVPVDFTGFTIAATARYSPASLNVLLSFTIPESWDAALIPDILYGGAFSPYQCLQYELLIDGESHGKLCPSWSGVRETPCIEIPLTSSERLAATSLVLRPVLGYATAILPTGGERHSLDTPFERAGSGEFSYDTENAYLPFPECDIVLPVQ